MDQQKLINEIAEIERGIAILPEGSIAKKKIRDKEYFYHRVTKDGKRMESYIDFDDVDNLRVEIEKRRLLEKKLKKLKQSKVISCQLLTLKKLWFICE